MTWSTWTKCRARDAKVEQDVLRKEEMSGKLNNKRASRIRAHNVAHARMHAYTYGTHEYKQVRQQLQDQLATNPGRLRCADSLRLLSAFAAALEIENGSYLEFTQRMTQLTDSRR